MANEEHLAILKRGVEVWNRWRKENRDVRPYLSSANLSGADLSEANLSETRLSEANLSEADLSGAVFREAFLNGANLRGAILSEAYLRGARLNGARLDKAHLNGAHFSGADLSDTDLREADLSGANFIEANLSRTVLYKANLRGADLNRTNFSGAVLDEADLSGITVGWTTFSNLDLSTAKGLDTVEHKAPSTIGIDTIYKSKGNIPESFLRGAGVPDSFIAYISSLTGQAIEYYSCFISYSSKDDELAYRLHNDLQGAGVRCWFAPEDMKIGDPMLHRIDESIRMYEKLLLILSENSIASEWVDHEVQVALAKERRSSDHVLFPIRVDDTAMETNKGWAATVRDTRHIGDFTDWKDHDAYQEAFDRLLRDLKAEGEEH